MEIMLDTNAYSDWRRGLYWASIIEGSRTINLCSVALGEILFGFEKGRYPEENNKRLKAFLGSSNTSLVSITARTSEIYAQLISNLQREGKPIPTNDVWIAASAIENNVTLLTRDKHFKNIPQLSVLFP